MGGHSGPQKLVACRTAFRLLSVFICIRCDNASPAKSKGFYCCRSVRRSRPVADDALTGPDGVLLVNDGIQERGAELLAAIPGGSSAKRVQAVFNTDWRPENTGSNEMFRSSGAKVIAHENTKLWLGVDIFIEWVHTWWRVAIPTRYRLPSRCLGRFSRESWVPMATST